MGAAAIMLYQTIISRNIAAQDAAVLTVGVFHAGVANNVIPGSAELKLNIRWFNEKSRDVLPDGIKKINEGIAFTNDLPKNKYPTITMKGNAYPLVNDSNMVTRINKALDAVIRPEDLITHAPPVMASEDFHHLVFNNKKTVYDYLLIGTANPELVAQAKREGKTAPFSYHNDNYQVDLAAIPLGTMVGATAVMSCLKKNSQKYEN